MVCRGMYLTLHLLEFTHLDRGEQGTDADACGSEVVDFVDLQAGIDLAGAGQNLTDLIRGHGIQTAAEGI